MTDIIAHATLSGNIAQLLKIEGYVYSDPVIARLNAEIEATLDALREHDLMPCGRAREISFTLRIKDL